MAVEVAQAYVTLIPKFPGAQDAIAKELGGGSGVERAGKSAGLAWVGKVGKVVGGAAVAAIGATAGIALSKGFARAIALQEAEAKLKGLGHSAESVAAITANALAAVKGTAFGLGDAASVAASAVAAGVRPGQDLERTLKLVADASTIAGTDMGSMGDIFNKVAASNKVQMNVINQLHAQGVPALALVADQMGVTAEEASKMVSSGKVDFATFQAAMEKGLGGAALESGNTFRGAMANAQAALGRLGAQFMTPLVQGMPQVFAALGGAVDQAGAAMAPLAEKLAARLGPALEGAATKIRLLDLGGFVDALRGTYSPMSGAAVQLKVFEDSAKNAEGPLASISRAVNVAKDAWAQWKEPLETAWKALNPLGSILRGMLPALDGFVASLGGIGASVGNAVGPILVVVAEAIVKVADALGGAVQAALPAVSSALEAVAAAFVLMAPVLADIVPFLADLLVAAVGLAGPLLSSEVAVKAVVAAFLAWKAVGLATTIATTVAGLATSTVAWGKETVATLTASKAKVASKAETAALAAMYAGSWVKQQALALAGWVRETSAIVAHKVATIASNVATKAMTVASKAAAAAQWLLNTALSANPIGLVVTAVAALVAGLVVFFTKTEAGKKIVEVVWGAIKTAISAVSDWFTNTLWPAIRSVLGFLGDAFNAYLAVVQTVWSAIQTAISTAWGWIRDYVFTPIGAAVEALKTAFDAYLTAVQTVWSAVQSAISTAWDWIRDKVFAAIQAYVETLKTAFGTGRDVIVGAWNAIRDGLSAAWGWIRDNVFERIKTGVDSVKSAFDTAKNGIVTAFNAVKDGLSTSWNWINDNVFQKIRDGVDAVKNAFETAKTGIGTAWDAVKEIVAAPIRFVVNTVYNDGIRKWWNAVAGKIAPSTKLDEVALGFARGTEDHRAQIARAGTWRLWAEPETGGEAYIPLAPAKRPRSTQILAQVADRFGYRLEAFGGGGLLGAVGRRVSDAKKAAELVASILRNPEKAIKDGVGKIADTAWSSSGIPGSGFLDMIKEFPGHLAQVIVDKVKGALGLLDAETVEGAAGPAGSGSLAGTGVAAQTAALRALDPTARVTSGLRPGAITAVGTASYHGKGRAIDIVSPNMGVTWDAIRAAYGAVSPELFFTPRGMLQYGKPYNAAPITRQMHYDHVHWAFGRGGIVGAVYDQGGWMPSGTAGVNLSGRPEAVLSPDQTAALKAGIAMPRELVVRDVDNALIGRVRVEAGRVATGRTTPTMEGRTRW